MFYQGIAPGKASETREFGTIQTFNRVVVTGGAGFIGSAVVRNLVTTSDVTVITVDKLSYAGNLETLDAVDGHPRHHFERIDVCDEAAVTGLFDRHQPDAVLHLAAETHVDRSIGTPRAFVESNIVGTYCLLEGARTHWQGLSASRQEQFRFIHVSTDEVYGSLGPVGKFDERTPYRPNSPYAASKASSDHLVRAWHRTYGLPAIITHCSNNFGPFQYPEKLIPVLILNAISGKPLPIYGRGDNVRDWLHVGDHVTALITVLQHGEIGETYDIGGDNERSNLELARSVCAALDQLVPTSPYAPHAQLIRLVQDRPGHDTRYAIESSKIRNALGWFPTANFHTALRETVAWYLEHRTWCEHVVQRVQQCAVGDDGNPDHNPLWTVNSAHRRVEHS